METFAFAFAIGSCVTGNIIDGIFVKGSCVSEEKPEELITIFQPVSLNIDMTRGWITKQRYMFDRIKRNPYFIGPTFDSNWLIRKSAFAVSPFAMGAFAMGGYPDTPRQLQDLQNAGLETFVCLNSEYGNMVNGQYFRPYGNSLSKANFMHEPIDDMETVKDETVIALAEKIVERLLRGESIYLHCAGGHGRTGTVAFVVLHMLYPKLSELELFEFIQYAHDQRRGNYFGPKKFAGRMIADPLSQNFVTGQVPTPQTIEQRDQVRRIIK
jgi:hypothetical protein